MKNAYIILVIFAALMQSAWAKDNINTLKKVITLDNEKQLDVKISFSAGKLYIHPGKPDEVLRCKLEFSEDEPSIDYSVNDDKGILEIGIPGFGEKDDEGTTYNFKDLDDLKKNKWHLYFSTKIPIKFVIENGAAENRFEFGGMKISEIELNTGASETYMNFSEPNPIDMRYFTIESGVSEINAKNLLNANFDKFRFDGGVGDFDFFFTGKLKKSPRLDFDIGVAGARIVLDEDTPFKVRVSSSFLSSIDIEDADEEDDDYWVSDNYESGKHYLNMTADVGIGGFKIRLQD